MSSQTEENYLKAIFKLSEKTEGLVSTNAIATVMNTAAASVTDMAKRLSKNGYLHYEPYRGVRLSEQGENVARGMIRKHRIWEVFLCDKLNFNWEEVHEIAEHLEHIPSDELINRLEHYLGYPKFDPHGDPIPDQDGHFINRALCPLTDLNVGAEGVIIQVGEHSKSFLNYLNQLNLLLGTKVTILDKFDFDGSVKVRYKNNLEQIITQQVGCNLLVEENNEI